MTLDNRNRVEKIEAALTPQQTALLLMKKALSSASDYRDWFSEYLERYEQIRDSRSHKLPPFISDQRIRASFGELNVLLHIWMACNEYAVELQEKMIPLAGWLSADLEEMCPLIAERKEALPEVPYPLDRDDGAAVRAAIDHYVVIFHTLIHGYVPTWLEQYRVEPAESSKIQSPDGPLPQHPAAKDAAEPAELARQESLPDWNFDEICFAFEKAVRALVTAGELEGGSAVEIGPLPFEFLATAPLVDGQWIDRHVVELAELATRAEERGFEFRATAHHWLLPAWIYRREGQRFVEADEAEVAALRDEAEAALVKFEGRTTEIAGRIYLHVDDYRAWPDRKVMDELELLDGVSLSSWNTWIDAHGGEGAAELAGIKLGKFDTPVDGCGFVACPNPDDLRRRRDPRLSGMANAILGDRSCAQPRDNSEKTDASPLESEQLVAQAHAVRDNVMVLLENLFGLRFAMTTISESYFVSHPVLFKGQEERLHELIDIAEKFAELYHKILDVFHLEAAGSDGTGGLKVDIEKTKLRARNAGGTMVISLIYRAKRGALLDLGAAKCLSEVMLAHLKGDSWDRV
jgi:hypothetical protein